MSSSRRSGAAALAPALLVLLVGPALLSSRIHTPTFDEPAHIAAGLSYLKTGDFRINLQHPPLLKEIAAVPLLAVGARWPVSAQEWARIPDPPPAYLQWELGYRVLAGNGFDRALFLSRLPFIALAALGGWLLFVWGKGLLGAGAAAGAVLLYALDPAIEAHGHLVTTDVGFAVFTLLFLFALWRWVEHRSLRRLVLAGAALGLALASKFSAVLLLPVGAVLVLGAVRWIPPARPMRHSTTADPFAGEPVDGRIVRALQALLAMSAVAAAVVYLTYLLPSNPFLYFVGLRRVNADHDPSYWPYLAGTFRPRFLGYYATAYLLKTPLPSILLTVVGLGVVLRRGAVAALDRAFLLLPPAALFAGYTFFSHNLGLRYVIPALPFLHLVGGAGLAYLIREGRFAGRVAAVVLCAWLAAGAAGIHPDQLAYFNEAACLFADPSRLGLDGGSRCGPLWLDDSNVDWGQGLRQLGAWVEAHPSREPLNLAYFGSMRPEDYGLVFNRVDMAGLMQPRGPGRYAVSAHFLARATGILKGRGARGPAAWLLTEKPSAVVGHAYYIYDPAR